MFRSLLRGWRRRIERALVSELRAELGSLARSVGELKDLYLEARLLMRRIEHQLHPPDPGQELDSRVPVRIESAASAPVAGALAPAEMIRLASCPVCEHAEGTLVSEYNKFLLLGAPYPDAERYDYTLCHACGVVSARLRPTGAHYRALADRFEETIGRPAGGGAALGSAKLTADERAALAVLARRGVFVSEHAGVPRDEYVPALQRDRLANSAHVELLTSLLSLKGPRVLELRPRLGSIGAGLRRAWDAEVFGIPLFEGQQVLMREAYGITADALLDYDNVTIPYEGSFDLIVANHMLTHVVHPRAFFETVRGRLRPGGHLYMYNEPDDAEYLKDGRSMINTLNAFHLQAFDRPSLQRALAANGFEPVFVTHHDGEFVVLARAAAGPDIFEAMSWRELKRRREALLRARDMAILALPAQLRAAFAGEWQAVVERGFAAGLLDMDAAGEIRIVKSRPVRE